MLSGTPGGSTTGSASLSNTSLPRGDDSRTLICSGTSELLTKRTRTVLRLPGRLTVYGRGSCTALRTSSSSARIVVSIPRRSASSSAVVGKQVGEITPPLRLVAVGRQHRGDCVDLVVQLRLA